MNNLQILYFARYLRSVQLSFFNDLQVSPDGRYVYIADVSFFGKNPAIIGKILQYNIFQHHDLYIIYVYGKLG